MAIMLKLICFIIAVVMGSIVSISYAVADSSQVGITPNASSPVLESIHPSNAVIPVNTLRFYLYFSNAMQRGQVAKHIWVEDRYGEPVENPFLNLGVELWDPLQKRLTLLVDPGRIKTGVGPNQLVGTVFKEHQHYAIVVSRNMRDVNRVPTAIERRITFTAGPAVVDPVDVSLWDFELPSAGTRSPFIIRFDRIMDVGTSKRMISIHGVNGKALKGRFISHGTYLEFFPLQNWVVGAHRLKVNAEIEDVSGNSIVVPFEKNGVVGDSNVLTELTFKIISG